MRGNGCLEFDTLCIRHVVASYGALWASFAPGADAMNSGQTRVAAVKCDPTSMVPEDALAGLGVAEEPVRLAPADIADHAPAAEQMVADLGFADDPPAVEGPVNSAASGCGLAYLPDAPDHTQGQSSRGAQTEPLYL